MLMAYNGIELIYIIRQIYKITPATTNMKIIIILSNGHSIAYLFIELVVGLVLWV